MSQGRPAFGERHNTVLIERRLEGEVEAGERLDGRAAGQVSRNPALSASKLSATGRGVMKLRRT